MPICNARDCEKDSQGNRYNGQFMTYLCKKHLKQYDKNPNDFQVANDVLEARHRKDWGGH